MSISSLMTNVIYVCLSVDSCIHMPFQYNFVTERTAACTSILLAKKPKCPHDILESLVHPQSFIAICRYSSRYFIQTIQLCLTAGHNSHTRISKPITRAILQFHQETASRNFSLSESSCLQRMHRDPLDFSPRNSHFSTPPHAPLSFSGSCCQVAVLLICIELCNPHVFETSSKTL